MGLESNGDSERQVPLLGDGEPPWFPLKTRWASKWGGACQAEERTQARSARQQTRACRPELQRLGVGLWRAAGPLCAKAAMWS